MTVMVTEDRISTMSTPSKRENKKLNLNELRSSPMGNFQLLQSSQSSEGGSSTPIIPSEGETRVLKFKETLSEDECRNFNLIYESLLLEGKAGNLTNLTSIYIVIGYIECLVIASVMGTWQRKGRRMSQDDWFKNDLQETCSLVWLVGKPFIAQSLWHQQWCHRWCHKFPQKTIYRGALNTLVHNTAWFQWVYISLLVDCALILR